MTTRNLHFNPSYYGCSNVILAHIRRRAQTRTSEMDLLLPHFAHVTYENCLIAATKAGSKPSEQARTNANEQLASTCVLTTFAFICAHLLVVRIQF